MLMALQQQRQQQQLWPVAPNQPRSSGNGAGPADPATGSAEREPAVSGSAADWQSPTASAASRSGGSPRSNGGAFSPEQVHRHHPPHPPLAWAGTVGAGGAAWEVPLQGGQPEEQRGPREGRQRQHRQERQTGGTYNWWRPPFG